MAGKVAPRSSILILLLAVAITACPLRALVHSHAAEHGSGHDHHHSHYGYDHAHHHDHDGDDEHVASPGSDHHSALDDTSGGLGLAWIGAWRRIEVAMPSPAPAVLMGSVCEDWQPIRRAKPPPWLLPARSSQVNQLRTVILQV